jgi:hypothetical protein
MDEPRCSSTDPQAGTPERMVGDEPKGLGHGRQRWGSTGKQATMDVDLSGDTTIGVALGDDEVNLSMGSPYVFPAPARERLKAMTKEQLWRRGVEWPLLTLTTMMGGTRSDLAQLLPARMPTKTTMCFTCTQTS